ncbi:M1 family metallopeptidase [Echinicola sediminis]
MNLKFYCGAVLAGGLFFSCQSQQKAVQPDEIGRVPVQIEQVERATDPVDLIREKESAIAAYRATPERKFDLLDTELDLGFDFKEKLVHGDAVLTLKPYFYQQSELIVDAKDFDIHAVNLLEGEEEIPLGLRYDGKRLKIYLPSIYSAEDTLRVRIKYTAHPSKTTESGSQAITDTQGLYFINPDGSENKPVQIWTQGETEHNSKWFPTIDAPNERATHRLHVTVEDNYTTISNGKLLGQTDNGDGTRTDHWLMDKPHAPYLVAMVVGEFAKIEDRWEGLPVNYYVEEKYKNGAAEVFKNTPEMMTYFSDLLGVPFPWQKYDQIVVRDFVSGAMENTTASIFMEELNMTEREALDNEYEGIIAHELFHQWFGNYVTTESWSNLPLNEAFANYGEYLWYEHHEGRDAADLHHIGEMETYFWESEEKQVDLIRYEYEDNEDMFDSHSYAKGGRVLHMLRDYLGDEAFFKGLKAYLSENAFKSVEIHDLRLAMEETSGKDLNWFFNQWFMASGHPVLDVKFDYSQPENLLLTVMQKQDLNNTPLYVIPFEVSWYVDGERCSKRFVLDQAFQQFALENGEEISLAYFDEKKTLLAEINNQLTTAQWLEQLNGTEFAVSRYEALDSLSSKELDDGILLDLINVGLDDPFGPIREVTLGKFKDFFSRFGLEGKVLELAARDDSNSVRASAIEVLSEIAVTDYSSRYLEWLEDSSYYVAGAALNAYLNSAAGTMEKERIASSLEEEENIRILVPIVDFYTREQVMGKGAWLHEKFDITQGQKLYYLIGYYADYFSRLTEEGSEKAIDKLYQAAMKHRLPYVRLAAFQGLFGFIDDEGVLEKLEEIHENEKDPEIKKAEAYFLLPNFSEN